MGKPQKRKSRRSKIANAHRMFPEMLAALANVHTHFAQSLLKNWLQKLHQSLEEDNTLTNNSLFSLLPVLLRTAKKYPAIARCSAEILGAAALLSFDANDRITSDTEIIRALIAALTSGSKRVSMAACNAILDLSTTSVGRQRLCQFSAVEKLMSVFLQDATCPAKHVSICSMEKGNSNLPRIGAMEGEFPVLVLDVTVTLINTCNVKQLAKIPRKLTKSFLSYLKELWVRVRDEILSTNVSGCSKMINYSFCNLQRHDLTESIFRLSINLGHCATTCTSEVVKRSIFGPNQSSLEHFMLNYWEDSPFLLRSLSISLNDHDDIFRSFLQSLNLKRTHYDILSAIIGGLVSCPPIPSDELDILNILEEVKDGLGCPIIYGQDIRILKTVEVIPKPNQGHLKREVHLLKESAGSSCIDHSDFNIGDVQKCEEAYQEGYTIALRGLEFRSENIAAIADGLAVLFGQPSVGANAYLTPPRSQGLARHYDDHCVFVCQLRGRKQWTIFPRPTLHLPRLYEPLDSLLGSEGESVVSECKQFLLEEGDILYIPRGCPHEACTTAVDGGPKIDDASTGFSLHLTLGIEIEPPFEWEGFAHVALHCWNQNQNQKQPPCARDDSLLGIMSINFLHVAIQLIGDNDPTFRKACMVAAFASPSETKDKHRIASLDLNQRTTFSYVTDRIDGEARFFDAFKMVEVAVEQKKEDPFPRMRWLRHLYQEGDTERGPDWNSPSTGFEDLLLLCNGSREDAEAAFMQVKSKFCRDVVFEDVCESFEILLQKYKSVRKQYTNGMLSLHYA